MKKFLIKNGKYIFIFIYMFFSLVFFYNIYSGDTIANFGFSYAIANGEIPYNDFNMVIPVFSPFLYSLPLIIFGNNIIIIYLFQSLLITTLFYFLFKQFKEKAWILLIVLSFAYPILFSSIIFPGYNFLLFYFFTILYYLEKNNKNDYIIGLIVGLTIITKHTIGILFILPCLIYCIKEPKRIFKRFIGISIPLILFFTYLIISNSLSNFINLCIMGLLDFNKNNNYFSLFNIIILLICIIIVIYKIIKDRKDITNYYALAMFAIAYPIIDQYHISFPILTTILLLLPSIKLKRKIGIYAGIFITIMGFISLFMTLSYQKDSKINFYNFKNFPFRLLARNNAKEIKKVSNYISKFKEDDIVIFTIGTEAYSLKIQNNFKITYFDLLNYGNLGYNGTKMMTNKIEKMHNKYFLINIDEKGSKLSQLNREIVDFAIKKSKLIDTIDSYNIYYKK